MIDRMGGSKVGSRQTSEEYTVVIQAKCGGDLVLAMKMRKNGEIWGIFL